MASVTTDKTPHLTREEVYALLIFTLGLIPGIAVFTIDLASPMPAFAKGLSIAAAVVGTLAYIVMIYKALGGSEIRQMLREQNEDTTKNSDDS